jgi:hypothetical protein
MTLAQALWMVSLKQAERIATPGQWKVWREGSEVRHQVLSKGN